MKKKKPSPQYALRFDDTPRPRPRALRKPRKRPAPTIKRARAKKAARAASRPPRVRLCKVKVRGYTVPAHTRTCKKKVVKSRKQPTKRRAPRRRK